MPVIKYTVTKLVHSTTLMFELTDAPDVVPPFNRKAIRPTAMVVRVEGGELVELSLSGRRVRANGTVGANSTVAHYNIGDIPRWALDIVRDVDFVHIPKGVK